MSSGAEYAHIIKNLVKSTLTILLLSCYSVTLAQVSPSFYINGNAYQANCNCYTLTDSSFNEGGSVWNKTKIDLTQSFDFYFNVFLGCLDSAGGDGIVFVLQNSATNSIGSIGEGMGYAGITPSIGITIDTYRNTSDNDPNYDHIAIQKNGDVRHSSPNNLAGPVPALATSNNIEDCQWHLMHVTWDATGHNLSAQMDGVNRVTVNIDLVNQIFSGNTMVYWGFTGSTLAARNLQKFCTSLNPVFSFPTGQKSCYPDPIQFQDSSISLDPILKWYWNFGDGTVDSLDENPPPHIYPSSGVYNAQLSILGDNGCFSDTFNLQITVGSKPIAGFGYSYPDCAGVPLLFSDSSKVQFGSISQWIWSNNTGSLMLDTIHGGLVRSFPEGMQTIKLVVGTKEGCSSDTAIQFIVVNGKPLPGMNISDVCLGQPAIFSGINADPPVPITQWYWLPGDGTLDSSADIQHLYTKSGKYQVGLFASNNGCYSDTISKVLTVYETNAYAGRDTTIVIGQPLQLNATGGELYSWSPATGLNNAFIADPVAILQNDQTYILKAYTPAGCATTDTIQITVVKGPAIYVPNAFTPNNDGLNDRLHFIAIGIISIDFFNIYNRYGQLVYSSTDPKQGWDGTLHGKAQPTGTYVWMIEGRDLNGAAHGGKGTVTLIR